MPTLQKEKKIAELKEKIAGAKSLLLTDFTGLNVEQISELRKQLRQASVDYKVVKNTLARISVEQLDQKELLNFLDGPTAIAFGQDDPIASAKIITEFAKKTNKPSIKAYFFEGQAYEGKDVEQIAKLPDKNTLIAQLMGTINAPLSSFVSLLNNLLQQTVYVLSEIKEKKSKEEQ